MPKIKQATVCFNCGAPVEEDKHCYGCRSYVCDVCEVNWSPPVGKHKPEVHLHEPREDDEEEE